MIQLNPVIRGPWDDWWVSVGETLQSNVSGISYELIWATSTIPMRWSLITNEQTITLTCNPAICVKCSLNVALLQYSSRHRLLLVHITPCASVSCYSLWPTNNHSNAAYTQSHNKHASLKLILHTRLRRKSCCSPLPLPAPVLRNNPNQSHNSPPGSRFKRANNEASKYPCHAENEKTF